MKQQSPLCPLYWLKILVNYLLSKTRENMGVLFET